VSLLGKAVHGCLHAGEEKTLGFFLAAVAVGCCDKFVGLGNGEGAEKIGIDRPQGSAEPDVEEVRKVCIAMLS
jgi:hypothetical protein